jgi:hypothetical protein
MVLRGFGTAGQPVLAVLGSAVASTIFAPCFWMLSKYLAPTLHPLREVAVLAVLPGSEMVRQLVLASPLLATWLSMISNLLFELANVANICSAFSETPSCSIVFFSSVASVETAASVAPASVPVALDRALS